MDRRDPSRPRNRLLDALPESGFQMLASQMAVVRCEQGEVLHRPGEAIDHVWFPLDSVVSITVSTSGGHIAEAGVAGSREVVGINALMGGRETTQTAYVVQAAGDLVKVPSATLKSAFEKDEKLRSVLLRYTQAFIAQISQNVACNGLHTVDQRYARWLLECRDRTFSNDIRMSQGFIARMLGVRRPGVTVAAGKLRRRGVIELSKGSARIVDTVALEKASCECYAVLRDEYARLLNIDVEPVDSSLEPGSESSG